MRLVGIDAMRELDRRAVQEHGLPVRALMEVAGAALAREAGALRAGAGGPAVLLCGGGHNGGDGLVAARHLAAAGVPARVVLYADPARLSAAPAANLALLQGCGVPVTDGRGAAAEHVAALLCGAGVVVDGLLGTGFRGPLRPPLPDVIAAVNACGAPVVSADIPSGLSGEAGMGPDGPCIRARRTVCFGAVKAGVFAEPGRGFAGEVRLEPLGIPEAAWQGLEVMDGLEPGTVAARLPARSGAGHKGTYGTVLVLAGALGFSGAAALCAEGALRAGAGLCRVACPDAVAGVVAGFFREATVRPLPSSSDGGVAPEASDRLPSLLEGVDAVVAGPGLGRGPGVRPLVARLLAAFAGPVVLDADACNAADLELLRTAAGGLVITPHPGEAARLLGSTSKAVQGERAAAARRLAADGRCVAVLKGAGTLVAGPSGPIACNPTGNDGMGTGGSGDVLAGFIGGLLAAGAPPADAAAAGVYVHGLAGDLAAAALGRRAMLAGDVLRHIPAAFHAVLGAGRA
jgi:NAD(P)H-hydrate epimerase